MMSPRITIVVIVSLLLGGCGAGGMTRAMQPVVEGFEDGECISREIRGDEPCPDEDA